MANFMSLYSTTIEQTSGIFGEKAFLTLQRYQIISNSVFQAPLLASYPNSVAAHILNVATNISEKSDSRF